MRSGVEADIHFNDIKVGDIIKIKAGMDIPVDGIILNCAGVAVTEAAMTGESDELKKDALDACLAKKEEKESENAYSKDLHRNSHDLPSPLLLSGTQIVTGEGWFVCIVVGEMSAKGKIDKTLQ
jgi:magnesium-transporting ATPase (P-type)